MSEGQAAGAAELAGAKGGAAASGSPPWLTGAPAELVGYVGNKGWKSPAEVAEGYRQLEKLLGGDKLALPKDEADKEGWGRVWQALGRPEKPEAYKLPVPDGFDEGFAKAIAPRMHELGLSARQAEGLAKAFNEIVQKGAGEAEAQLAAQGQRELAALRTEWGGEYDGKRELARRALRTFFKGLGDDGLAVLESAVGAGALVKGFAAIGALVKEDPGAGGGGTLGFRSAESAKAEIERLKGDESFMRDYLDGARAGHHAAVERMSALWQRAAGA